MQLAKKFRDKQKALKRQKHWAKNNNFFYFNKIIKKYKIVHKLQNVGDNTLFIAFVLVDVHDKKC